MPLAEVITDFFDQMKSQSRGYASMEYAVTGYRPNDLVRLDILINGEVAQPLSAIVHAQEAHSTGKALTRKLKELIPRQQFKVPIQVWRALSSCAERHPPALPSRCPRVSCTTHRASARPPPHTPTPAPALERASA